MIPLNQILLFLFFEKKMLSASASAAHRAERKWSCPNNQFEGGKYHRRHETIDISSDFILFYFLNKKRKSINQKNDLEMTKQRNRREKTTAAATKKKTIDIGISIGKRDST